MIVPTSPINHLQCPPPQYLPWPERHQWACLVLLMGGVALIQVPAQDATLQAAKAEQAGLGDNKQKLVGLAAVLAACFSSG